VASEVLARAVARVERLDERDGLGVGAGVEGRCARTRPRDEERVLAGGGDGGLVAAARFARVDGDVVDGALEEPRWRRGDIDGLGASEWIDLAADLKPRSLRSRPSFRPLSHTAPIAQFSEGRALRKVWEGLQCTRKSPIAQGGDAVGQFSQANAVRAENVAWRHPNEVAIPLEEDALGVLSELEALDGALGLLKGDGDCTQAGGKIEYRNPAPASAAVNLVENKDEIAEEDLLLNP
jgi:hypothetical protein